MNDEKLVGALNLVFADTYSLYLQTQNFHWNIVGDHFYALHLMFEKFYEEYAEAVDMLAEHMRTKEVFVDATFDLFSKTTKVDQTNDRLSELDMVKYLLKCEVKIIDSIEKCHEVADKEGVSDTANIMDERKTVHAKHAWMLRSTLNKV